MEGCGDFAARLVKWAFPGAFGSLGDLGGIGRLDEIVKGDDACSIGLFAARIFPNAAFAWFWFGARGLCGNDAFRIAGEHEHGANDGCHGDADHNHEHALAVGHV